MADDLPLEVLCKVFSHLSVSDRLQCNIVCRKWHWALLNPILHDRTEISFKEDDDNLRRSLLLKDGSLLETDFSSAVRSLRLQKMSLDIFSVRPICDWTLLLSRLKCLTLEEASVVNETELVLMLKQCVSLAELTIRNAREVFISGGFLSSDIDQKDLAQSLKNVTHLDLSRNSPYLTDRLLNRIVLCTPNLTSFSLVDTKILSHSGIYKKYYPGSVKDFNSPSVLTWRNIVRFLSERGSLLKKIDFYNSNVSSEGLMELGQTPNLVLHSLNVGKCGDITQDSLSDFCSRQKNLKFLCIDFCRRVLVDHSDKSILLFQRLENIESLSMIGLSIPKGMKDLLMQLRQINSLDLSSADIPSTHVIQGLSVNHSIHGTLESLKLNSIGFGSDHDGFIGLVPSLGSLVHLELRHGHEGVTDRALIAIIECCPSLETLILSHCAKLTDFGFTGVCPPDFKDCGDQEETKIFLGSKAEAELRQNIKRMEYISSFQKTNLGTKISQLRRLSRLELENVAVTEISIINAFAFENLRHINLSLCKSIRDEGFPHLAAQNPRLETVIVKQCNLSDTSLLSLVQACPRLLNLDVEACSNITSASIELLPKYCRNLRTLDLSFCSRVKSQPLAAELFRQISSLRAIGLRGHVKSEEGALNMLPLDMGNKPQPPPPPPPPRI